MTVSGDAVLAVDVGGSSIKYALSDTPGRLHHLTRVPIPAQQRGPDAVRFISDTLHAAAAAIPAEVTCRAIGLIVPGIVDPVTGTGVYSVMLQWRDAPLAAQVTAATGLPVTLGHDVSTAALAEQRLGAAVGHRDWLFVALGTGLGSAFMIDGWPYRGCNNWGGELAHVKVEDPGPVCPCGKNGCAETLFSAAGLRERYREATGHHIDVPDLLSRVRDHEPAARSVWQRAVHALSLAVSNAADSLNPSLIVVGGGLADAGDLLLDPLRHAVQQLVRFVNPVPSVVKATLGADAGVHGAALLAHGVRPDRPQHVL